MSRTMARNLSRGGPRVNLLWLLAVVAMAATLSVSALAQSVPFPTYQVGANQNGSQGPRLPFDFAHPMGCQ